MSSSHLVLWKSLVENSLNTKGWREESREKNVAKPRFGESLKNVARLRNESKRNKRKRERRPGVFFGVSSGLASLRVRRDTRAQRHGRFFWLASGVATFEDPNASLIVINEKKCTTRNSFLFSRTCLAACPAEPDFLSPRLFRWYSPGFSTPYREKFLSKFCWIRDFFHRITKHEIFIPCAPTIFSDVIVSINYRKFISSNY